MSGSRNSSILAATFVVALLAAGLAAIFVPATFAQTTVQVTINDYSFLPPHITVVIGVNNTVTWTNQQTGVPHTVTSNNGTWGSGTLSTGQSYTHIFTAAGTFEYHCSIHTYMKGTVVVVNPASASTTTTTTTTTSSAPPSTTSHAGTTSNTTGGVPEFPYSFAAVAAISVFVAASYLFARRSVRPANHPATATASG
ncbi:MAG: cupredoxin domain-containing protein [Nitrososphaerota archaeon]|nr:cupredoxin domain-containing protein [Nitrososphaerota archaeon]